MPTISITQLIICSLFIINFTKTKSKNSSSLISINKDIRYNDIENNFHQIKQVNLLESIYSAQTSQGCTLTNCNPINGKCINLNTCECKLGYVNVDLDEVLNNGKILYCTYQQKSQLIAFLLEFFFWVFAIGHFYAGRLLFAIIKMCVMLILPCCFRFCRSSSERHIIPLSAKMSVNFGQHDRPLEVNQIMRQTFDDDTGFKTKCFELIYSVYSIACALWIIIDLIIFAFNGYSDGNNIPLYNW